MYHEFPAAVSCLVLALTLLLADIGLAEVRDASSLVRQGDFIAVQEGRADAVRFYTREVGRQFASPKELEEKMVHAEPVSDDQFSGVVRINYVESGTPSICTGVLVAKLTVLTAAHCSCGDPNTYEVHFRWVDIELTEGSLTKAIPIVGVPIRYAGYSCELSLLDQIGRDLAILRLDPVVAEARFSRYIDAFVPIASTSMANVYRDRAVSKLVVLGYGLTEIGEAPEQKRIAYIKPVSYFCSTGRVAASPCAPFREFALSNVIPGPGARPSDSCLGDSGGPVLWFTAPPEPHRFLEQEAHLVGITSRGIEGVTGYGVRSCGGGGIYTNVGHSDVLAWMTALLPP